MKNQILLLALLLIAGVIQGQSDKKGLPISIGYFSHLGYQPGLKLGTTLPLKDLMESDYKSKSLFVSPQIGFYIYPKVHTSYLVSVNVGLRKDVISKAKYSAWSIGLGYLNQHQITGWRVRLADGSKDRVRENWHWLLSTLNYEFGRSFNESLDWYCRFSGGMKFASKGRSTALLFIELGLSMDL